VPSPSVTITCHGCVLHYDGDWRARSSTWVMVARGTGSGQKSPAAPSTFKESGEAGRVVVRAGGSCAQWSIPFHQGLFDQVFLDLAAGVRGIGAICISRGSL
jgi:hypothetical protein